MLTSTELSAWLVSANKANTLSLLLTETYSNWAILLNVVHTRNLQFLAIFHNLAANVYELLP